MVEDLLGLKKDLLQRIRLHRIGFTEYEAYHFGTKKTGYYLAHSRSNSKRETFPFSCDILTRKFKSFCDLCFKGDHVAYGSTRLGFMIVFLSHSW